mgnify:CR=1 FL=1
MDHWIYIEEGHYPVESGFIFTPGNTAVTLDDGMLEVYSNKKEERRVRGQGMAVSALIVELLEDYDDLDILIDLGDGFHYILKTPLIKSGKVFTPDVKSMVHFIAERPLEKLDDNAYERVRTSLSLV